MITIRLISRSSGRPLKGKKVALGIGSVLSGGVTHGKWTDANGEAHFEVKPSYGKVFVSGMKEYEGHLSGRVLVYI
jgi:hypothetical protein